MNLSDTQNPNNTNKYKIFIIALVMLIVVLLLAILNLSSIQHKLSQVSSKSTTVSNSPHGPIVYPPNPQKDGRDIYYQVSKQDLRYSGYGYYGLSSKPGGIPNGKLTEFIIGSFAGWENIPNSKDKYLLLYDPVSKFKVSAKQLPKKIRVGFASVTNYTTSFSTFLGVEDLSGILPIVSNQNGEADRYTIDTFANISATDLNKLIRHGDVLAVTILTDPAYQNKQDLTDKQGNKVAAWIFIRRYKAEDTLSKELGRRVVFKN